MLEENTECLLLERKSNKLIGDKAETRRNTGELINDWMNTNNRRTTMAADVASQKAGCERSRLLYVKFRECRCLGRNCTRSGEHLFGFFTLIIKHCIVSQDRLSRRCQVVLKLPLSNSIWSAESWCWQHWNGYNNDRQCSRRLLSSRHLGDFVKTLSDASQWPLLPSMQRVSRQQRFSLHINQCLYQTCIILILLYGSETWTLLADDSWRLQSIHMSLPNVNDVIAKRRLVLARFDHVVRPDVITRVHWILFWGGGEFPRNFWVSAGNFETWDAEISEN